MEERDYVPENNNQTAERSETEGGCQNRPGKCVSFVSIYHWLDQVKLYTHNAVVF